ncbi:hypothetical protein [Candidatus Accumulibacter phosphatis]|uniref:hypothetical protein n=1 Tax=Candidatus Accumulibacter phosphatis TaxID=327160 RepID=UPI0020BED366|nr:hypothetical protein [Candidatus Accumulibacter phosphatis]
MAFTNRLASSSSALAGVDSPKAIATESASVEMLSAAKFTGFRVSGFIESYLSE